MREAGDGYAPTLPREPDHLFVVSEWSAHCTTIDLASSCVNALQTPLVGNGQSGSYAWTDLTYLLHKAAVSWKYYVAEGSEPDCDDNAALCAPVPQLTTTPSCRVPTGTPRRSFLRGK